MNEAEKSNHAATAGSALLLPDGFGRAAEKLADTVRHVIDLAAGPDRIRAKIIAEAEGQAAAMVALAQGRAKLAGIESRVAARVRKLEVRRQENTESIVRKAVDALPLPEQVSEQPVDADWISRFFQDCQDISDDQMQQVWARILAGEVARPGSFSRRTLSVVRDLAKGEADLFVKLCSFAWIVPGLGFVPLVHDIGAQHVNEDGINFATLTHLASIGLIEFNSIAGYQIAKPLKEILVKYCDRTHHLKSDGDEARTLSLGKAIFTSVGRELLMISNAQGDVRYEKAALEEWAKQGWKEQPPA
jgi:hypothetical protein